jgi:hypothetical protein
LECQQLIPVKRVWAEKLVLGGRRSKRGIWRHRAPVQTRVPVWGMHVRVSWIFKIQIVIDYVDRLPVVISDVEAI